MIWKRKSNKFPKNDNSDLNFTFSQNKASKEDILEKPSIKKVVKKTVRKIETELFAVDAQSQESPVEQQCSLENIML